MALSDAEVEEILSKYLDRASFDPDRGFISQEDLKQALRELLRMSGDRLIRVVQESSSFGSYARHIVTPMEWQQLRVEAGSGSLPAGVLAIVEAGILDPQQKILAWTGTEWLDMAGIGALPRDLARLIISPTPPAGVFNLMWLDTSTGTVPYPLKAWDGLQWLEVTEKGDPGETLHPEGFVDTSDLLPDPPLWQSGPNIGQPKELVVYTTITDKRLWVYNPGNPSAATGPAVAPTYDAQGNLLTPAEPPAGWIDLGVVEGPPGPQGPPGSFRVWDVTEVYKAGDVAAYNVPGKGVHLFLAQVDGAGGPPDSSADWTQFAEPPANRVIHTLVTGETPIVTPPTGSVIVGDLYVNEADSLAWVYAEDPPNSGTHVWKQLATAPGAHVHVTTVTGDNPQTAPFPRTPQVGDLYVNDTDGLAWAYAEVAAGTFDWQIMVNPIIGAVMTSSVSGQDPTVIWPTNAQPNVGDMVINTADNIGWAWTGGAWAQIAGLSMTVTTTAVAQETPTSNPPTNPLAGDMFVNTLDQKAWIYDGTSWFVVSEPPDKARGTVTYVTDVTPIAPFTAANNWGFGSGNVEPDPTVVEPEPGDAWINHLLSEAGVFF